MLNKNTNRYRPLMSPAQVAVIQHLLGTFPNPVRVLEWGSGNSSLYFTTMLESVGRDYEWVSVESDPKWQQAVTKAAHTSLVGGLKIRLVDFGGINPRHAALPSAVREKYVGVAAELDTPIDLVIIDGSLRRRCLAEARKLQQNGLVNVICLMDANKEYRLADEQHSLSGEVIQAGVYPYRAKHKPLAIWIGCANPDRLKRTLADLNANVDLDDIISHSDVQHRRRNSWYGRLKRRIGRRISRPKTLSIQI
jgi:hypothetical protein